MILKILGLIVLIPIAIFIVFGILFVAICYIEILTDKIFGND